MFSDGESENRTIAMAMAIATFETIWTIVHHI